MTSIDNTPLYGETPVGSYVAVAVESAQHVTAAFPRGTLAEALNGLRHVAQLEGELEIAV